MTIKQQYTYDKKTFNLIEALGDYALYKQEGYEYYELLKLRTYKKTYVYPSGASLKEGDIKYPSINEWGKFGWSYLSKEDAMKKMSSN